ncbi:TPA: type IV secretion system DNA-binding domain-containing protein, partial [Escherichia coli]
MASINTIVKRKQYLWLGIVVVGTASAIGGALYLSDVDMSGNGETVAEQEPVPDMTGVVDTTFDDKVRQHATTEMQVTAAQMQKQYEEIRRELDVLNKQRGDDQRRIEKLGQDNAALAEQVKALGANPVTATGEPVPQTPASPPGPEGEPQPGNTPVSFPPQGSVAVPPPTAFYPGNGVTPPPQVMYQSVPVPNRIPTLHKLPDLVEILPEARKFGGCYVFGIQSYAQLEDIYGEKAAATLFDVMNTRAFFRSPSHKIAEFAAGEIGEKEHLKASEQYSYGADPVRDGVSTGKDMERQTLVSYSDIQSLPDLTCYVTLPGPYPAVKLSLKYQARPKVAPEFIPRDINPEMENRLSAVLAAREAEGRQMASLFEPEVASGEGVTQAEQ